MDISDFNLQKKGCVICDEFLVRNIANTNFDVGGFWVQELLTDLYNRNEIDFDTMVFSLTQLAEKNYKYISFNFEMVERILIIDEYRVTKRVEILFKSLCGVPTEEIQSIVFTSKLIKSIWYAKILPEQRNLLLDRLLDNLTKERIAERVIQSLIREIRNEMLVAPVQYNDVFIQIQSWLKLHPPASLIYYGRR